jgi:hypothetical protein
MKVPPLRVDRDWFLAIDGTDKILCMGYNPERFVPLDEDLVPFDEILHKERESLYSSAKKVCVCVCVCVCWVTVCVQLV